MLHKPRSVVIYAVLSYTTLSLIYWAMWLYLGWPDDPASLYNAMTRGHAVASLMLGPKSILVAAMNFPIFSVFYWGIWYYFSIPDDPEIYYKNMLVFYLFAIPVAVFTVYLFERLFHLVPAGFRKLLRRQER